MTSNDWAIEFYVDEHEYSPVRAFIAGLDKRTQLRLAFSIEQLRTRNARAQMPLVRHLEGNLWELREESNTNIYRIMYFFFTGRRIVLLHGFQKKTQRTPRREIETARRRQALWLEQKRGD